MCVPEGSAQCKDDSLEGGIVGDFFPFASLSFCIMNVSYFPNKESH